MEEGQTGDEVKLPRFSREVAVGLRNFSVDAAAVAWYLEAVASRSIEARCTKEIYSLVKEALAEGLGAKTRLGYGIVKLR